MKPRVRLLGRLQNSDSFRRTTIHTAVEIPPQLQYVHPIATLYIHTTVRRASDQVEPELEAT